MNTEDLHEKFVEYGRNAREWKRKCLLLLPDIEKYEIWQKKGFESIYDYAMKLAGIGRWQVDDAIRIYRKIEDKSALLKVAKESGLNKVRPIATIATKKDADYWARQASTMSINELETFVRGLRQSGATGHKPKGGDKFDNRLSLSDGFISKTVIMRLKPKVGDRLEKLSNGDWNTLMEKFLKLHDEELEQKKPKPVKTTSRHIPKNIENFVQMRANYKCEFPSCMKDYDHLHHTNRFASDNVHDPDQIIALCEAHHRLAHRGLIDNETGSTDMWKIRKEPDSSEQNRFFDEQVQFYRRR